MTIGLDGCDQIRCLRLQARLGIGLRSIAPQLRGSRSTSRAVQSGRPSTALRSSLLATDICQEAGSL